jgi:predicted kinase
LLIIRYNEQIDKYKVGKKMNNNYETLKLLVPKTPGIKYEIFFEVFPGLKLLAETPQDAYYHAEGDVWTHTKMVCDELIKLPAYQSASDDEKFIMFYSCLLHDISKPACTKHEDDGRITSKGHSKRGAVDTRIDLWRKEVPFELREAIVNIIGSHQVPFFAFKAKPKEGDKNPPKTPEYIAHELSWQMPLHLLINVAKADMLGRYCVEQKACMDDIELFEQLALEEKCLFGRKKFGPENADDLTQAITRMKYFASQGKIDPNYAFYEEIGSEVIVLCGLPASGKNTWIEQNFPNATVLSFDDAKEELGLKQKDNAGSAVHLVIDRAKELLRKKEPFIWNATHLSSQMRNKTLDLLYRYNAKVKIVYLEAPDNEIKKRNSARDTTLPNAKIEEMLFKWEVPTAIEAHEIHYEPMHLVKQKKLKM